MQDLRKAMPFAIFGFRLLQRELLKLPDPIFERPFLSIETHGLSFFKKTWEHTGAKHGWMLVEPAAR